MLQMELATVFGTKSAGVVGFVFVLNCMSEGIYLEFVASIQHAQAKAHLVLFVLNDREK
jgi:hypothetical protein